MSKGERYDQLLRAMRGEINIMIGPRSALFTPFSNLGLIVIDEEHEGAYKSEQSPKFHARETAEHIAKMCSASLVLGSATPSMESYYRAMRGEYKLFTLTNRAAGGSLPTVYTEDLREELKSGNRSIFSRKLQELISDRLEKKEQIMLFLNKRGYAGFISCRMCGHVLKCPHCDISMTIHRGGTMVCHYCGYSQPQVRVCPECGSKYISGFKAGTQQVEDMVKKMYPDARVLRMDMDTTSGKEGHEKVLSAFANREADILIGTQMIVKGHDFPDVTLVGILAADMSLYAGDYRAAERTFQLLTQAAGRAGRGEKKGEVVIQTYTPDNYSIKTAAKQDYKGFYEEEIAYRQLLGYPPVRNMLMITFASKDEERLNAVSEKMKKKIALIHEEDVSILGPVNAQVYKLNDYYNRLVYVRSGSYEKLTIFKDWLEAYALNNPLFKNINIQYEFN
jgi:primosomal protein N' (replication factor Y)